MGFPKQIIGIISCQVCQFFMINEYAFSTRRLDFIVSTKHPFRRMAHNTDTNHIQINIDKAKDVLLFLPQWHDSGLPSRHPFVFSFDYIPALNDRQPVGLILESFFCFKEPLCPSTPVFNEFKKELPFMASMR